MIVITLLAAALMLWFKFGIRPFDRLNARVQALSKTDPEQALALYPEVFAELDKEHMSLEDRGMVYLQFGRFLKSHGRNQQAIENFQKSIESSGKGWKGITRAGAILDIAESRLALEEKQKPTRADIDNLTEAAAIHPSRESGEDKWFWPAYDQALGRMYACIGDYPQAMLNLQKALDEYKAVDAFGYTMASHALIIDTLIRQGKYVEANKKFIEACGELTESGNGYQLRKCFRKSLKRAQDKDPGFRQRVQAMLDQRQFAALDKLADEMTESKRILPSGRWHINDLYGALDSSEKTGFDSDWRAHINLLEQWVKARPDSSAARVALGQTLVSYAWEARGSGYSDTVTEEGWKKFGERLKQAKAVLDQVKDKPAPWYSAAQRCALGQGWERGQYDAMVAECRTRYPDYDMAVFTKSYWLQPRWHGKDGEFESYLAAEAGKRPAVPGDILYARTAWHLDDYVIDNIMNETKLSWPRVKSGLQQVIKQYPDSLLAKGMLSILAMEVKDQKTAESAFTVSK